MAIISWGQRKGYKQEFLHVHVLKAYLLQLTDTVPWPHIFAMNGVERAMRYTVVPGSQLSLASNLLRHAQIDKKILSDRIFHRQYIFTDIIIHSQAPSAKLIMSGVRDNYVLNIKALLYVDMKIAFDLYCIILAWHELYRLYTYSLNWIYNTPIPWLMRDA